MNIDLHRLKIFYIVGREQKLSRASETLGVTQCTVSRSIIELEREMHIQLLIRTPRGVKLTTQGERVYEFAKKKYLKKWIYLKRLLLKRVVKFTKS